MQKVEPSLLCFQRVLTHWTLGFFYSIQLRYFWKLIFGRKVIGNIWLGITDSDLGFSVATSIGWDVLSLCGSIVVWFILITRNTADAPIMIARFLTRRNRLLPGAIFIRHFIGSCFIIWCTNSRNRVFFACRHSILLQKQILLLNLGPVLLVL